jgi:hypothetical protein
MKTYNRFPTDEFFSATLSIATENCPVYGNPAVTLGLSPQSRQQMSEELKDRTGIPKYLSMLNICLQQAVVDSHKVVESNVFSWYIGAIGWLRVKIYYSNLMILN